MRQTEYRACSIEGCCGQVKGRGLCGLHYQRWRKTAAPEDIQRTLPLAVRFWNKVETKEGCWRWLGGLDAHGYAQIGGGPPDHRMLKGHRVAYELVRGAIPSGLVIDHLCRNKACVNPWHMEPVSNAENVRRAAAWVVLKTRCKHGHAYDDKNTYRMPSGWRDCKQCVRERGVKYRAKKASLRCPA